MAALEPTSWTVDGTLAEEQQQNEASAQPVPLEQTLVQEQNMKLDEQNC